MQIHPEAPFLLSHSPKKEPVHLTAARHNLSCTIVLVAALLNHGLHRELERNGESSFFPEPARNLHSGKADVRFMFL